MPGKQNDDEREPKDRYVDYQTSSIHVSMRGMDLKLMRLAARMRAAQILQEDSRNLWLIGEGTPRVTQTARFEEQDRPTEMSVDYTFGIIPPKARPKEEPEPEPPEPAKSTKDNVVSIKHKRPVRAPRRKT